MKERDIDEIIANHLMGNSSENEQKQLRQWAAETSANANLLHELEQVWAETSGKPKVPNSHDLIDKIWEEATGEPAIATRGRNSISSWKMYTAIAATIVLLLLAGQYVLFYPQDIDNTVQARTVVKEAMAGQKLRVTLPDSSVVWINSTSSIEYPEFFTDSSRVVKLTGEAYFDVQKDPNRSFVVEVEGLKVKALGTSFNINAFEKGHQTKVALVEGIVQIVNMEALSVMLSPGELATYNNSDKKFEKSRAVLANEVSWKEGRMIFSKADFDTVIKRLERWYGVNFIYDTSNKPTWDFTADFTNYSLENVLTVLGFGEEVTFTRDDKNVYLTF